MRDGEFRDEAYNGEAEAGHDEWGALLDAVGPEGEDEDHDRGEDVDWDCEELGIGGHVA